ncbi:LuxR family transcriptional regulator [Mucilaginibacter limnophilus]|uniref:LuxR family transcriptional regulator n=1 Tax=Mucilaginibacter limnophilus TaxID=1932778 RepID=A0A437MS97_9SPHI|nr:AAA family ATPase [Mucilaginibacter limnophilus]RVU00475.1 LuxR family transcriptional regulator [Mucilaginibacter limnophilus]
MFEKPFEIQMIYAEAAEINKRREEAAKLNRTFQSAPTLLNVKPANYWMQQEYGKPQPKALFDKFFQQDELCIMFADTNAGKSILAVQIADSITGEYGIGPFQNSAPTCTRVLYVDFEQSAKQFESRYLSPHWGSHIFSENFFRAELNHIALPDAIKHKNYNEFVKFSLKEAIKETQPQVLIIDNITYISTGTQYASSALELMKTLKELKSLHNLSVLVLAHTPKRNPRHPLTVNDLQGSKMLINFADSAFAIGQSYAAPNLRYLKQIKQRSNSIVYGDDNICVMSIAYENGFLQYKFENYATEAEHLMPYAILPTGQLQTEVQTLHTEGKSLREIARELNIHHTTVFRVLKRQKAVDD